MVRKPGTTQAPAVARPVVSVIVTARGHDQQVRAAEVIGAACLATDLGMGFPFEHGLEATMVSSRLSRMLDVDIETESEVFYVSLLMYLGCNTDSEPNARLFGGSALENITPNQFGTNFEMIRGVLRTLPPRRTCPGRRQRLGLGRIPHPRAQAKPNARQRRLRPGRCRPGRLRRHGVAADERTFARCRPPGRSSG